MANEFEKTKENNFLKKLKSLDKKQWFMIVAVVVVIVATVVASVLVVQHRRMLAKQASSKKVITTTTEKPTTTEAPTTTTTTTEPPVDVKVHMQCSSIKEDLEVTIINEKTQRLQKGTEFSIVLTDNKNKQKTYKDKNKNGLIYISKINAGKYKVELKKLEGYEIKSNVIEANVKAKPDYKPVKNMKSQIDAGYVEDGGGKHNVKKVSVAKDTVPKPKPIPTPTKPQTSGKGESTTTQGSGSTSTGDTGSTSPPVKIYNDGWNCINGSKYYYVNNAPIKGRQIIGGIRYYFDGNGALQTRHTGIDVSYAQGTINWSKVKQSGIGFAIIRLGFRGYGTAKLKNDSQYYNNIRGATRNGISVGVYFFSQAINEAEAIKEASLCLDLIKGYRVSLPIYIDSEWSHSSHTGRADYLSREQRTKNCLAFCRTIQEGGHRAGVYASECWFGSKLNVSKLRGYDLWVAKWSSNSPCISGYDAWQYSDSGNVCGIKGKVDLNYR